MNDHTDIRVVELPNCITVRRGNEILGSFAGTDCQEHAELFAAALASQQEVAAPVGEADSHLKALLHYTGGFYGAAIEHGMKAGETANAVAHVERAARALHRIAASRVPVASPAEPIRWHELKTDPDAFDAVASGAKTHEIRRDDRNFKVGDGLLLRRTKYTGNQMHMRPEACPLEYTGEECRRVVSHIQTGYGLGDNWCILSFAVCAGGAGVMDARPDSFHSDSGECDRVQGPGPTDAERDVLAERARQINEEGWTAEHDDAHDDGSMAKAAACYALGESGASGSREYVSFWPWGQKWAKFSRDKRRNLVKAGALILAEIERLDRAAILAKGGDQGEGK